jgi:hypothetical protein
MLTDRKWLKPRIIGSIVQKVEILWTLYQKSLWVCAFKMRSMLA